MADPPIHRRKSPARNLGLLLKSHYLADEFPSVLTTENLAAYCVANYKNLATVDALLKRVTQYARYSAPRQMDARRPLALPHPASQLALCRIISDSRHEIETTITASSLTLYSTKLDVANDRLFVGVDFKARVIREAEVLARYPFVLITDVVNFFHTIYSHSLPWAVLGKQYVKDALEPGADKAKKRKFEKHWSNKLDVAIQRGNSRETFGIPVGPDTSRMIAEILLAGIHSNETLAEILRGREGYRLVDDFFIGFDDETSARNCRDVLRRVLWEYNLHLNEGKTKIERSSMFFTGGWKHEIESFDIPKRGARKQRDAIQRLMEISLHYCSAYNDPVPASFFCQRLTTIDISVENFPFARDCMLRVARDFTSCLKTVVKFVTQFRFHFSGSEPLQVMRRWLGQIFSAHTHRGHDMEVANALGICGILGIPATRSFVGLKGREASPVVLAVLGLLSEDGLLDEPWDEWKQKSPGQSNDIVSGPYWLPYYEAALRKWTQDIDIFETFAADEFFGPRLDSGVTFLDASDFRSKVAIDTRVQTVPRTQGRLRRSPILSGRRSVVNEYD